MNFITTGQLTDTLSWRYATKEFDSTKKIPEEVWTALEDALVLTPSSFGLQPWKFIVVQDSAVREKLKAVSWGQGQVTQCSHHVVFAVRTQVDEAFVTKNMELTAQIRNVPVASLDGFKKVVLGFLPHIDPVEWGTRQAYIALGNFMTSAALVGVDTCPMEGIDAAKYDEILQLSSQGLKTVVACSAGYRSAADKYAGLKKVRFNRTDLVIKI